MTFRRGEVERHVAVGVVVEVTDNTFTLWPRKEELELPDFRDGETVDLVMAGQPHGLLHFPATVVAQPLDGEVRGATFMLPGDVQQVQRREFPRIKATLPIRLRFSRPGTLNLGVVTDTTTADLSAGGFRIVVAAQELKIAVAVGDSAECDLTLSAEIPPLRLPFDVVRMSKLPERKVEIGARFKIDERDRSTLTKFVFKYEAVQRHLR